MNMVTILMLFNINFNTILQLSETRKHNDPYKNTLQYFGPIPSVFPYMFTTKKIESIRLDLSKNVILIYCPYLA